MHAHGINVLDKTDGNHLVLGIAHHFELQFFPAQDRFLDQYLTDEACRNAAAGNGAEFLDVVNQTTSGSPQAVCRPNDHRIAELIGNRFSLLDAVSRCAPGHIDVEPLHGILEGYSVLPALDGIDIHADDLDAVFLEHALASQL